MNSPNDSRSLVTLATEAIERAGALITARTPLSVIDKGDRDIRTDVDQAAEQCIRDYLANRTPAIPVLGEESGGPRLDAGLVWVLDPIDGTINYLHGMPTFAVSISLIEDGRTVLGAIHLPVFRATYTVLAGSGACVGNTPIHVTKITNLRDAVVSIDQLTYTGQNAERTNAMRLALLKHLSPHVQRLRIHGASAVDLAWTAEGRLDACIILGNHPWDTSAGVLLARQAGATVVDIDGKEHSVSASTTVAAAPGIADQLLGYIDEAIQQAVTSG